MQQQNNGNSIADPDYSAFKNIPEGCARQKAILFERLIELGHQTDLVRCRTQDHFARVRDDLALRLDGMLSSDCDTKNIASKFLDMAGSLCRATGAPVYMLPKISGSTISRCIS